MRAMSHKANFVEICENVEIDVVSIIITVHFFVIKSLNHCLILDCSFERKSRARLKYLNDESCEAVLHSEEKNKKVSVEVSISHYSKNKFEVHLFTKADLVETALNE